MQIRMHGIWTYEWRRTDAHNDLWILLSAKNIFIIDTLQYRNFYLNSQKYGIHNCRNVNTEGKICLWKRILGRIQRRAISNGYFIITWLKKVPF
jgi:hypothetical protein